MQNLDPEENDVLLMGDFSRDKPTHPAFSKLKALGVTNVALGGGVFTTFGSKGNQTGPVGGPSGFSPMGAFRV